MAKRNPIPPAERDSIRVVLRRSTLEAVKHLAIQAHRPAGQLIAAWVEQGLTEAVGKVPEHPEAAE